MQLIFGYLPEVVWPEGQKHALSRRLLLAALRQNNPDAPTESEEDCEHVACAVEYFLRYDFERPAVSKRELESLLQRALDAVGLQEMSAQVSMPAVAGKLSLRQLAAHLEVPAELPFYTALARELRQRLGEGVSNLVLCEAKACVKLLNGSPRWSKACERLLFEVAEFTRAAAARFQGSTCRSTQILVC